MLSSARSRSGLTCLRVPSPTALLAGPVGRVERELPGLELGQARAAVGAGVGLAEEMRNAGTTLRLPDLHRALRGPKRRFHGVGQPLAILRPNDQPVHHDRDVVVFVSVERGRGRRDRSSLRRRRPERTPPREPSRRDRGTRPSCLEPEGPAPESWPPRPEAAAAPRSATPTAEEPACRIQGSAGRRREPRGAADSRRPPSPSPRSTVGFGSPSSVRWRSPERGPRIESTSGFSMSPRNWRAYAERDST